MLILLKIRALNIALRKCLFLCVKQALSGDETACFRW